MKLRLLWLTVALALLLSCSAFAAGEEKSKTPTAHGIDVSHHQGEIDWDILAPHIDFAILRIGYGANLTSQDDRQWKNNADACSRLGIPFGVYIYSHAVNKEQALDEVQHVLRQIEGYKLSMPVYLDLEDNRLLENCSKAEIYENAKVFCEAIQAAGYEVGIYANTNWWKNYLTDPGYDRWDRWVAQYSDTLSYQGQYSMWQYTSKGVLPGITANTVDMNYWYGEPPVAEHSCNYEERVLRQASCTKSGLIRYVCPVCGDFYETIVQALGHDWDEGQVTLAPAPGVEGLRTFTCLRCGETKEESIPPLEEPPVEEPPVEEPPAENPPCDGGESCPASHFTDRPDAENWAHAGIDYAVSHGLFNGMEATLFGPEIPMSRAMLVTVLWRHSGSPEGYAAEFTDVPEGQWYTEAIGWAAEQGLVTGVGEGLFEPEGELTREQLAVILYRYSGAEAKAGADTFAAFADGEAVSDWAVDALCWAVEQKLISGTLEDEILYLDPQGSATRAQVATILMRYLEAA